MFFEEAWTKKKAQSQGGSVENLQRAKPAYYFWQGPQRSRLKALPSILVQPRDHLRSGGRSGSGQVVPWLYSIFRRGIWCAVGAPGWSGESLDPRMDRIQDSLAPGWSGVRERESERESRGILWEDNEWEVWWVGRRLRNGLMNECGQWLDADSRWWCCHNMKWMEIGEKRKSLQAGPA